MGYDIVPPVLEARRKMVCLDLGFTLQQFDDVLSVLCPYFPAVPEPDELYRPAHYYDDRYWKCLGDVERQGAALAPGESMEDVAQRCVDRERSARGLGAKLLATDRKTRDEALDVMKQVFANLCKRREEG